MIAHIPDTMIEKSRTPAGWLFGEPKGVGLTVGRFEEHLRECGVRVDRGDGWLLARRRSPGKHVGGESIGPSCAVLRDPLPKDGCPRLEEWLSLAATPTAEFIPTLGEAFPAIVAPHLRRYSSFQINLPRLGLFAALSPAQRRAALTERGLSASTLTRTAEPL